VRESPHSEGCLLQRHQRRGHLFPGAGARQRCRTEHLSPRPVQLFITIGASRLRSLELGQAVLFPPRLGKAEEFASLAVELLSNSYMNAESIRIDAGIRMQPK
jgi:hypothetical protein